MDFPNKKKDLTYSSFEEFQKNCNFDFSNFDFNKPAICNSLLKLYDEGYKFLTFGDDEKAYMLLFRFFESYVKLRSSKLYKNDKAYVESLISQEKLNKSLSVLEKLKAEIKQRYEDRLTQTKNEIHKIESIPHEIEVEIETRNLSNYLNPTELVNLLRQGNLKILIIDIRDDQEFFNSRMNLDILMTENIKLKNLISYINIPGDIIKPTTWEINEELIKKNPNSARIFSERNNFDHLILFDTSSLFKSLKQDSKILILKRAVYEFNLERVKNEPIILDGGWSSWLIYYPAYKTLNKINKNNEINEKSSIKNVINIEYPEVPTPAEPIPPTEPVINTQPEAPVEMPNKKEDIVNQVVIKPLVDRSNKPAVKEITTVNSPIINRLQKPVETDNKNNPVTLKDFLPVNTLNHVDKPQFNKIETLSVNDVIFNSVYAPTRFKVIHTPFMKEGNHKVLNLETGMYQEKNDPHRELNPKPTIKPEIKEPVKPVSNLKRTFSSPNISNLENLVLNDESKNEIKNDPVKTIPSINRSNKPMSDNVILSRIEELEPVYANIYPGLTGIRNLGNTCFMNSIIQCISNTELLVKFFLSGEFTKDLNRKNILGFKGEIADEFSVIVKSIWSGHCKIISPKRFKYLIGEFNQQFISNEQQDAQEFLLFLLDGLHEDLNRVKNRPKISNKESENEKLADIDAANLAWNLHLSLNNSIIVDLFQGQFKSTVACNTCNKSSVKFDAFMYLTLPISSSKCDIYDCLELFLKRESMCGESKWKCPNCKQYRDSTKKIDIWKLPPLLIIHLKRFKYDGVWRDKITSNVDYPIENLNLNKYLSGPNMKKLDYNYKLYGISNHSGTMDGGHYTSMCRNFQLGRWFKYDDSEVKEITSLSVLKSPTNYILFYSLS